MFPDHPSAWPQRPLIVQPTPQSSTKIIGIRLAKQNDYENFTTAIVPINNGREEEGESLVVDFESIHFVGTLLLRIKQAPTVKRDRSTGQEDGETQRDYFSKKKRKFQVVLKGRFRTSLSMSRCVTGQIFDRPAGKLPARWLLKSAISFLSVLAPQLDVSLDDDEPKFLSPLVATAQTVLLTNNEFKSYDNSDYRNPKNAAPPLKDCDRHLNVDIVTDAGEPPSTDSSSILSDLSSDVILGTSVPDTTSCSVTSRTLARKKIFNTLSAKRSLEPRFDTKKIYTFEFFQHLLDFGDELALDMGRVGGKVSLAQTLNFQPLKIFAAYKNCGKQQNLETLWSFDIFHESLYYTAESYSDKMGVR